MNTEEERILREHGESIAGLRADVGHMQDDLKVTNGKVDKITETLADVKSDVKVIRSKIENSNLNPGNDLKKIIAVCGGIGAAIGMAIAALGKALGWW